MFRYILKPKIPEKINWSPSSLSLIPPIVNQEFKPSTTIVSSCVQTKEWRRMQLWYSNGKKNECENYQKRILLIRMNIHLEKTNIRMHYETFLMVEQKKPLLEMDGFE